MADNLAWFRDRLLARVAGLLDDSDASRFDELASSNRECARLYDAFKDDPDGSPAAHDHLTEALIARWNTAKHSLRGLERRMVRAHLERCGDCRQDLEILGFQPTLEYDAALDGECAAGRETDRTSEAEPLHDLIAGPVIRIIRGAESTAGRWKLWLGGWAVAATAACGVLIVTVISQGPRVLEFAGGPIAYRCELPRPTRASGAIAFDIPADTRIVVLDPSRLSFAPTADPDSVALAVSVAYPDGRKTDETHTTLAAFQSSGILLSDNGRPLTTGTYAVEIVVRAPGTPPRIENFPIVLSVASD